MTGFSCLVHPGQGIFIGRHCKLVRHWRAGEYTPARLRRGWMPPHPTLYVRREWYERIGSFNTGYRIAADYDCILRLFSHPEFKAAYIPEVLVTMRVGGASNRSLRNVIRKSREDYLALRANGVGGLGTLAWKNVSKVAGFDVPIWWWFCDAGVGKGGILPAVAGGLS